MLISLFKFRSTFGRLSWEKSWNKKARNGALNLRTSYTLAIVLEFFPMICGVIIFFTAFGAIGHSASIVRDFMDNGLGALATYLTGSIAFIVILILAGLTLWICKIIRLFSGWNKIKNGFIRKEILAGHQPKTDAMVVEEDENDGEDEEESVIIARPESDADEDNDDLEEEEFTDNNRNLIIGGSIAGAVLIIALILWFCRDGNVNNKNIENDSIPLTEIKFSDENEVSEHSASSDIIEQEPQSENIVAEELQTDDTSTSDTGVPVYKGSIGGKYAIVMTLIQDGSKFTGEYRYIKKDTPIQLRGEFTDGYEHLVLEEYQGMDMTGKFEGILANDMYDGTWTSADGTRRYPFTVVKHYRH